MMCNPYRYAKLYQNIHINHAIYKNFRYLQDILIPYKTTDAHNSINNQSLNKYAGFNRSSSKNIFMKYSRCYMGPVIKSKITFLYHRESLRFIVVDKRSTINFFN